MSSMGVRKADPGGQNSQAGSQKNKVGGQKDRVKKNKLRGFKKAGGQKNTGPPLFLNLGRWANSFLTHGWAHQPSLCFPLRLLEVAPHAVVARSTFPSQNVQKTSCWDHFWKLRCRKSARCCGAKHMWKAKCVKKTRSNHLWTFNRTTLRYTT